MRYETFQCSVLVRWVEDFDLLSTHRVMLEQASTRDPILANSYPI